MNFAKFLGTPFLQNTSGGLLLKSKGNKSPSLAQIANFNKFHDKIKRTFKLVEHKKLVKHIRCSFYQLFCKKLHHQLHGDSNSQNIN